MPVYEITWDGETLTWDGEPISWGDIPDNGSRCRVYRGPVLLGLGYCGQDSYFVTDFLPSAGVEDRHYDGRNVTISITEPGVHIGRSWTARVLAVRPEAVLLLQTPCPFIGL